MRGRLFLLMVGLSVSLLQGQQSPKSNGSHEMNKRGDQVMGFDHMKTTHHFRLFEDGGALEITANSAADTESRDQIRMHLGHIAKMFGEGNFKAPMLIHEQTPPGVPTMQKLKKEITYSFQEIDGGAAIRISTKDASALEAIHSFLRFQIKEHKTGHSPEVTKQPSH
jgi:hypothetical protein